MTEITPNLIINGNSDGRIIYTGEKLKSSVFEVKETREFLIQSLIAKKSTTMIFAPDGIGKSTILLQILLEGSNGSDVFGGLKSRPINSILMLTERPKEETFERIQYMNSSIDIGWDRIIVSDDVLGLDLVINDDYNTFLRTILELSKQYDDKGGTDCVWIDTMYGAVSDGLSNEKACGQVNKLLRKLQATLGCACVYTHHTNRGQRNKRTGQREAEDMYGNRALSSNCTGIFHLTKTENGTMLEKKKDSLAALINKIDLRFDPETYMSLMAIEQSTKFAFQKIETYLNDCFKLKKDFSFNDILSKTGVSVSYLRDQISVHLKSGKIINRKPLGQKALYAVLRDF